VLRDVRKSTVKELKEGTRVQFIKSHDGMDVGKLGTVLENFGTWLWFSWDDNQRGFTTNTTYADVKLVYSPETDLPLAN